MYQGKHRQLKRPHDSADVGPDCDLEASGLDTGPWLVFGSENPCDGGWIRRTADLNLYLIT